MIRLYLRLVYRNTQQMLSTMRSSKKQQWQTHKLDVLHCVWWKILPNCFNFRIFEHVWRFPVRMSLTEKKFYLKPFWKYIMRNTDISFDQVNSWKKLLNIISHVVEHVKRHIVKFLFLCKLKNLYNSNKFLSYFWHQPTHTVKFPIFVTRNLFFQCTLMHVKTTKLDDFSFTMYLNVR
jgi:hypothetical protein